MDATERAIKLRRTRGLVLGLTLGDAIGALGTIPAGAEPLRATSAAQLACFTVEGLIRAHHRGTTKGICHPPSLVWHSLIRWAHGQGLPIPTDFEERFADGRQPDGWLHAVPALHQRRGSASATVTAIKTGRMGIRNEPVTASYGAHALVRSLTACLYGWQTQKTFDLAADLAALTHGAPAAHRAAAEGAVLATAFLAEADPQAALAAGLLELSAVDTGELDLGRFQRAGNDAQARPGDPSTLAQHASSWSADAVLAGALYAALSFPRAEQIGDALRFAAKGADAKSVAAVTGALLGAVHGAGALPAEEVSRLELAWVVDTLAHDMIIELLDLPCGHEVWTVEKSGLNVVGWEVGPEPDWNDRYPPW